MAARRAERTRARRNRRGAALIAAVAALGLTLGVTPAGAAPPPSADELTTTTLYTAIANSDVLGPVFAHADEIMMSVGVGREIPDGPRREITDEVLAEYAELDAQADALVDQIADDVLGFESQGLRQAAADYMGCAEAPVEHEFGSDSGQTSYISMEGTEAVVRITLDKPLCQPLPVDLLSFAKIDGKAWPHPQKLHDSRLARFSTRPARRNCGSIFRRSRSWPRPPREAHRRAVTLPPAATTSSSVPRSAATSSEPRCVRRRST